MDQSINYSSDVERFLSKRTIEIRSKLYFQTTTWNCNKQGTVIKAALQEYYDNFSELTNILLLYEEKYNTSEYCNKRLELFCSEFAKFDNPSMLSEIDGLFRAPWNFSEEDKQQIYSNKILVKKLYLEVRHKVSQYLNSCS